jgi:hypothetical protein
MRKWGEPRQKVMPVSYRLSGFELMDHRIMALVTRRREIEPAVAIYEMKTLYGEEAPEAEVENGIGRLLDAHVLEYTTPDLRFLRKKEA